MQSAGPRYNSVGEILPYSILGPVDQFQSSMIARGNTVRVLIRETNVRATSGINKYLNSDVQYCRI